MTKNEEFEIEITDMTDEGLGVGKHNGFTWFIKDSIVGDTVLCGVTKLKKNYGFARVIRIIKPSADRKEAPCPIARQCGGCQIQQMSYEAQLRLKSAKVRNALIRIGGFDPEHIDEILDPIVPSEKQFRYRNKAQFPIGRDKEGNICAGFYAGRTHSIIPCGDCLLGAEENRLILDTVMDWMRRYHIEPYDEKGLKGMVRHVLIRKSSLGGFMVCLVINKDRLPKAEELKTMLRSSLEASGIRLESLSWSPNTEATNVIMGKSFETIYGEGYIEDSIRIRENVPDIKEKVKEVCLPGKLPEERAYEAADVSAEEEGSEIRFRISPLSFYQVNPGQMERLYAGALEFAELSGRETVWDLYCGIGTISLFLAKKAGFVYGVEIVPQAIKDARANAALNHMNNTEFFVGKAEEVLPRWYAEHAKEKTLEDIPSKAAVSEGTMAATPYDCSKRTASGIHPDVIVVDPPRKGCDEACLETMVKMQPRRIVYVSCNPATLARDLKYLTEQGYELKKARPYDMFPQSVHVETVVLLSKVQK